MTSRRTRYIFDGDRKLCARCKEWLPLTTFPNQPTGTGGVGAYCKPCVADRRPRKTSTRPVQTSLSERVCTHCHENKPASEYAKYKGKPAGWCRQCRTALAKRDRAAAGIPTKRLSRIEDGRKLCTQCDELKPLDEFSPSARGLGGVAAYCKPCTCRRIREKPGAREKARAQTAAYRSRHQLRWRSLHRMRQFERNNRRRAQSDGTVTDEFLMGLYAQSECHYCYRNTPEDRRTADHKIPLIRGGAHSASNLVMACYSCNSSKRHRTDTEYIQWRSLHALSATPFPPMATA